MKDFLKFRSGDSKRSSPEAKKSRTLPDGNMVSQALVDLAAESWRLDRQVQRAAGGMDPMDADRFLNQFEWYMRKVGAVLEENGLYTVDLTGEEYSVGLAVTPLNLEDFPEGSDMRFRIAQMVEPIVMENGRVRKTGTVMLVAETEEM